MVRNPYLIQRAEIRTPLANPDETLSQAVKFDYMGSAEFEFGALPSSLRCIQSHGDSWKQRVVNEIKEGDSPLRVYSAFTDEEFKEYKAHLLKLRNPKGRGHTKESTYFEEGSKERWKYNLTDFWWDINNNVMFGFRKEFMNRLPQYLAASFEIMGQQK